jgi:hypothetical protein
MINNQTGTNSQYDSYVKYGLICASILYLISNVFLTLSLYDKKDISLDFFVKGFKNQFFIQDGLEVRWLTCILTITSIVFAFLNEITDENRLFNLVALGIFTLSFIISVIQFYRTYNMKPEDLNNLDLHSPEAKRLHILYKRKSAESFLTWHSIIMILLMIAYIAMS